MDSRLWRHRTVSRLVPSLALVPLGPFPAFSLALGLCGDAKCALNDVACTGPGSSYSNLANAGGCVCSGVQHLCCAHVVLTFGCVHYYKSKMLIFSIIWVQPELAFHYHPCLKNLVWKIEILNSNGFFVFSLFSVLKNQQKDGRQAKLHPTYVEVVR